MHKEFRIRLRTSHSANRKSSQRYLKFWDKEEVGKNVSRAKAQRAPRFGEINKGLSLRAWRLGAISFLSPRLAAQNVGDKFSDFALYESKIKRRMV
jgi:hypothetical protein